MSGQGAVEDDGDPSAPDGERGQLVPPAERREGLLEGRGPARPADLEEAVDRLGPPVEHHLDVAVPRLPGGSEELLAAASRSVGESCLTSAVGNAKVDSVETTCNGSPAGARKVVRRVSWRRITSANARSSAVMFSGPFRQKARPRL